MKPKKLIDTVRVLLQDSQPSGKGGFSGWLKNRLSVKEFAELVDIFGSHFKAIDFYLRLSPGVRTTCRTPGCNNSVSFVGKELRFKDYCSAGCSWKDPNKIARREANELERSKGLYSNVAQRPEVRARSSAVKRSVEYKVGMRERELKRSGGQVSDARGRPEAIEKRVASHMANELARSGGTRTNSSQREEVRTKISSTISSKEYQVRCTAKELIKSGGRYSSPSQRPEVRSKARKSSFERYEFIHGNHSWSVQGYEDAALDYLINSLNVDPSLIYVPRKRSFRYNKPDSIRFSRYIPDFKIRGTPLYIEVKSTWTARIEAGSNVLNSELRLKGKSVADKDFTLLILVMDKVKDSTRGTRSGSVSHYALFTPDSKPRTFTRGDKKLQARLEDIL